MEVRDALRSTASFRDFTDEPIGDDVVAAILDDARFAPSGGNRQPWRVAVVKDLTLRGELAVLMQLVWDEYIGRSRGRGDAVRLRPLDRRSPVPTPNALLSDIDRVPVVLAVAADLNAIALMDGNLDRPALVGGASIYPFCWNILLGARDRGLGGVMTTFLSRQEPVAAPLLGLPDGHALAATIFLGHVDRFPTKLRRRPVGEFATIDRFDGPPLPT